ncbi:MAG: hypothetical protein WCG95_08775 [bacterium]
MTAKEKAEELYNKFYNTDLHGNSVKVRESLAKQCAIIAVDEMIEQNGELYLNSLPIAFYKAKNAYLFEVKQEINNL